ncbi:uncharacterized protein TEOVI_000837400 [Trypanosoma equiperdum]|uniref:Trypanosome variant surface glycoprotein (A-type) n=1 Tax=Trypanosoma equiperdum TaxID=5694 RepID=A0A1G4I6P3_TRYEQ|nr:hypothetical protein, conserved [Trypanosoma equiperdum]
MKKANEETTNLARRRLLLAGVVIATLFPSITSAATEPPGQAEANALVTDFCSSKIYFEALETELISWQTAAAQRTKTLAEEAAMFRLAAVSRGKEANVQAYIALAAIAQHRLQAAASAAAAAVEPTAHALRLLSNRQGEIASAYKLVGQERSITITGHTTRPTGPGASLLQGAKQVGKCAVAATPTITDVVDCSAVESSTTAITKIKQLLPKATRLKIGKESSIRRPEITIKLEARGTIGEANNWKVSKDRAACEENVGQPSARTLHVVNGVAITSVEEAPYDITDEVDLAAASSGTVQPSQRYLQVSTTDKELASAIIRAQRAHADLPQALSSQDISQLSGAGASAVLLALQQEAPASTRSTSADQRTAIRAIFGQSSGSIRTEFIEPLAKDKLSVPVNGGTITGTTQTLAQGPNFAAALAHFSALKL